MLPPQAGEDQGAMAMKEYSEFPKAPALLEIHYQIVLGHVKTLDIWRDITPSEKQSVSSSAPAKWANIDWMSSRTINSNETFTDPEYRIKLSQNNLSKQFLP